MSNKRKLVVIGGGPGGYAAAFFAADSGMQVTLVDPEPNPGGVCLYRGCIPSKALLHIAKIISEADEAKNWGITFTKPKINLNKIRAWKKELVEKVTGGLMQLSKSRKIEYVQGTASFIDNETIKIINKKNEIQEISFEHLILATGSRPATIPGLPTDSDFILNSTSALAIEDIPKTLLVIGGGYIGLELGSVYAALGSRVSVVEMLPDLLPGADRDLVAVLKKRLDGLFENIFLNTTVEDIKKKKNGIRALFKGNEIDKKDKIFQKILVSVGRKPNSDNLGLENTRVELDEKRFVKVDKQRRTNDPFIFAIGDIVGEPMLAHKASHEGRTAVEAILGKNVVFEPRAIPAVVFTDPEIAWCGLTETKARKNNIEIKVVKFPWGASGRAMTLGRTDGFTKLIVDPNSDQILGVGIVGPGAGELISEGALALEMGAVVSDIELTIHPHPTLSETIMEAAGVYFGQSTHFYRRKTQ